MGLSGLELGYAEPCCLFSNQADLSPDLYSHRFQHEVSFRDLKSDGFKLATFMGLAALACRALTLVMALATLWSLTEGTKVLFLYPLTSRQQSFSVFRLGLDYLFERFRSLKLSLSNSFSFPIPLYLKVSSCEPPNSRERGFKTHVWVKILYSEAIIRDQNKLATLAI